MIESESLPLHVIEPVTAKIELFVWAYQAKPESGVHAVVIADVEELVHRAGTRTMAYPDQHPVSGRWFDELAEEVDAGVIFPDEAARAACRASIDNFLGTLRAWTNSTRDDPLSAAAFEAYGFAQAAYVELAGVDADSVSASFNPRWLSAASMAPNRTFRAEPQTILASDGHAAIDLSLYPAEFDEPTYRSLVYALSHEMICHVFQGPFEGPRVEPGTAAPFAEGWMDVVTYRLLEAVLLKRVTLKNFQPSGSFVDRQLAARYAATAHADRYRSNVRRHTDASWSSRCVGAQAAERVLAVLEGRGMGPDDALIEMTRMSLRLNAAQLAPSDRDAVAVRAWTGDAAEVVDSVGALTDHAGDELPEDVRQWLNRLAS